MQITVDNNIPQNGRYVVRLVPLDDDELIVIEWPSNPNDIRWSLDSDWETRNTAGARWDGQSDASDWTGNRPRRWTIETRISSAYDEAGVAGRDAGRLELLIAGLRGLMRFPTLQTGQPSRVRVESGESVPFTASLTSLQVDSQIFDAAGVLVSARIQLELIEQPDVVGANSYSDPAFDDWEW